MLVLADPSSRSLHFRWGRLAQKLLRYAGVSAIATTVTLSLLGLLVYTDTLSPGWANLVATAAGTVPSFELNRRWVWKKRGRRSAGEVVPFWLLSFTGLALSTLVVGVAGGWARQGGWGPEAVTVVSALANLATFGALWVLQYLILDRILFDLRPGPSPPSGNNASIDPNQPIAITRPVERRLCLPASRPASGDTKTSGEADDCRRISRSGDSRPLSRRARSG